SGLARENFAVSLRDAGRDEEAIAQLKLAAPDVPNAQFALGSALRERGDFRGAVEQLQAFVTGQPGNPEIQNARQELALARRAMLLQSLKERRFADAEREARALVTLRPEDAEAHNLLGVALASEDRVDAATAEFSDAVRLNPRYQDARDNLAHALGSKGK